MSVKVTLTMAPEVARQLAAELSERQEYLSLASEMIAEDEAKKLHDRVAFLGKALETLNHQLSQIGTN
jgi:hypothetical protein